MKSTVDLKEAQSAEAALIAWLETLRLGEAQRHGGLALIPLYHDAVPPPAGYLVLAEALASGDVVVTEQPHASVPTLQVQNRGALPVLILDGEEVVGGKQNRVVNTTLLVPPKSVFDLPVSCVEHGRWHEAAPTFQTGEAAYPTLRRQKMTQVSASVVAEGRLSTNQSAIWEEIGARQVREGTSSPTGAMRDSYRGRLVDLEEAEHELPCPADGPVGVVALVGGRAQCADIFDRATTLFTYWPRLVRSYALEAADAPSIDPSKASAERLVRRPLAARRAANRSAGLGLDMRFNGNGVVGAGLVFDGAVVHAALFRQRRAHAGTSSIHRPSQRARAHTHD